MHGIRSLAIPSKPTRSKDTNSVSRKHNTDKEIILKLSTVSFGVFVLKAISDSAGSCGACDECFINTGDAGHLCDNRQWIPARSAAIQLHDRYKLQK